MITEKIEIFQYLEKYEDDSDEMTFISNLISLVRIRDLSELFKIQKISNLVCISYDVDNENEMR